VVEILTKGVDHMKRQIFIACLAAAAACSSLALAGDGTGNAGKGNGNKTLTLVDGDTFSNPGQMFQYLRIRTDAAAGNPKAIVDAYPGSFENVGDLIRQKRDATDAAAAGPTEAAAPPAEDAATTP
jgi:hypothetical protein